MWNDVGAVLRRHRALKSFEMGRSRRAGRRYFALDDYLISLLSKSVP